MRSRTSREHEIVNDDLGIPLIVTYCSLCRSAAVADRRIAGEATRFRVSGLLWRPPRPTSASRRRTRTCSQPTARNPASEGGLRAAGNLVMVDDATRSLWSQLLLRGIYGPERANTLAALPSTATTWRDWHAAHPETEVLLPPAHSGTAPEPTT